MLEDCRPVLFIGSSGERRDVAKALKPLLSDVSEPQVWNDGAFLLGEGTLEALERLAVSSDFAVLVATPDDLVERRGKPARIPRDNILFELGLFIGKLGRKRTFIVCKDTDILPTDLSGITVCIFSDPPPREPPPADPLRDLRNALANAAAEIKRRVEKLGLRTEHSGRLLEGRWNYGITDARGGHRWGGKGEIAFDLENPTKVTMKGKRTWERIGKETLRRIACVWETTFLVIGEDKGGRLTLRFSHSIQLPTEVRQGSCELDIDAQLNCMKGRFYYHAPHVEVGYVTFWRAPLPARRSGAFRVAVIEKLADELGVPQATLLKLTKIAPATLIRRHNSASGLLSPEESDRVYRVAAAYRSALQLFEGEAEAARRWLNEPAKALGGDTPLQHLDAEAGAAEVQDLIGRLEHGVYT